MVSLDSVLTFYRNGEELFTVGPEASIYYSGGLGLGTYYRSQAYFDDVSVTRLTSTTGLKDPTLPAVMIYPNPTAGMLKLELGEEPDKLHIHSILGNKLYQMDGRGNKLLELNLSDLEQGFYFIRIVWKNGRTGTYRFVKD